MDLLLAPHNDDEVLFASYALTHYHPVVVVVTDSFRQYKRGTGITWEQRRVETTEALRIFDAPVIFAGIPDDELNFDSLIGWLASFRFDLDQVDIPYIFAPAKQGGHPDHDIVAEAAAVFYGEAVRYYSTYAKDQWFSPAEGHYPMQPDHDRKRIALHCYRSQQFQPHFKAVLGHPEYYSDLI